MTKPRIWVILVYALFNNFIQQFGPVAQLGARTVRIRKVEGSIPFGSTKTGSLLAVGFFFYDPIRRSTAALIQEVCSMIISASRRTDLPAFYPQWLARRFQEGEVLVRNPMNPHRISRISLAPDVVDGIVFWTKNPLPLMPYLKQFSPYPYYFQFTLTAYGPEVEPGLPSKADVLLPAFQTLSRSLGAQAVVWRYDPIFLTEHYSPAWHRRQFEAMAARLSGFCDTCVISFLDHYRGTAARMRSLGPLPMDCGVQLELLEEFSVIGRRYGLTLCTCAEAVDASRFGIAHGSCIDPARLERLSGTPLSCKPDQGQRSACGCAESIDIGAYDTCPAGCCYCYANRQTPQAARRHYLEQDPQSCLLGNPLSSSDVIRDRPVHSNRLFQLSLEDFKL